MNQLILGTLILQDQERIIPAITSGSQWEIWFQVEAYVLALLNDLQAAREVPYPEPDERLHLDLLLKSGEAVFAVEIKVESATNAGTFAGKSLQKAAEDDIQKIAKYNADGLEGRYVLIVAYSDRSKRQLADLIEDFGNDSVYLEEKIAVGVLNV